MLTKVTVTEGWTRYGSEDPVTPGDYYQYRGWMKPEVKEQFKQRVAPIAAKDSNGAFSWLMPYEVWVKRFLDGQIVRQEYGQIEDTPANRAYLSTTLGLPASLVDTMRPYQREFLYDYLHAYDTGAVTSGSHASHNPTYRRGDIVPLGGGKTLEGLCLAQHHTAPLVLAPTYCWDSWRKEASKWSLVCPRLSTYQSARKQSPTDCLLLDECLLIANPNTKVHSDALSLSVQARSVVALTGTPTSTSPMDLRWLRVVYPGCVPADEKPWRFAFGLDTELKEVRPGQKAYVTKTWDHNKVSAFVAPYCRVIDRSVIQRELPEITFQRLYVPAPKEYSLILKGAATERSKSKSIAQARMCTDGAITDDNHKILARFTPQSKLDAIEAFVQNLGEPVVLFARWQYAVAALSERFAHKTPSVLQGGASLDTEVERFTGGDTNLLIANACMSQGMNLQERARCLIFMSNSLKPTDREQAIGRVYRPGQKRAVIVVDVLAEGTLDEPALDLLDKHRDRNEGFIESALAREFNRQRGTA